MKRQLTRFIAVLSAVCITAGCCIRGGDGTYRSQIAEAKTLEEIEAEKKEKQAEIQKKKEELEALAKNISDNEHYQQTLQEEINLINSKMLLIDTQLRNVNAEIDDKQQKINELEVQIAEQQEAVNEGLEAFKQRIRTLYVHGNDSLLSALVGATDFYDVLAKIDLINRVAKHDDKMCKNLKLQLEELNQSQQDLTAQMQALSLKQTEMESLRKEFSDSRADLDAAMKETGFTISYLFDQQEDAEGALEEYQHAMDELNAEADAIVAEILRKEEEARRKAEEEEQRRIQSSIAASLAALTTTTTTTTTAAVATTAPNQGGNGQVTVTTAVSSVTTAPVTTSVSTTTATTASTAPDYQGGSMAWPAPGFYYISSPFGPRWGGWHYGIDIAGAGIHYANACAAMAGTVSRTRTGCTHDYSGFCGCNNGCGNAVYINHGNGLVTVYMHLASVGVSEGQQVSAGTVIGQIGATGNTIGNSGGYHLHFGVSVNGTFVDPMNYLS